MLELFRACFGSSRKKKHHDDDNNHEIETDEFMEMNQHHPIGMNRSGDDEEASTKQRRNSNIHHPPSHSHSAASYYYETRQSSSSFSEDHHHHSEDVSSLSSTNNHDYYEDNNLYSSSTNCFNLSPIKLNQNVKEYSTDEYKQLWKQFGDCHVTLEYSIIFHDESSFNNCEEFKSCLDHTLESNFIYTLASGVNHHLITFYNYCESMNNVTYLVECQVNYDTRHAKARIKYSANQELSNFVNHFEKVTASFFKRIK
ncbi:hypothetical protein FDP41_013549 [Naegleria fowleri]|uniref:Beta-adaptin appendage C-terminal subdomain domain-containing protein n=1 Tax=Naegleria fowleri TaxID=5763 RepID=A0A6A5C4B6_NAEFO|nr:uncharacterized protein FDP41_013549 [Naegleria fowleri]KAF0980335.1 hypothetical protein FDP41_013549 [Naegleria fowleri]CAG4713518.1 unnamed protein product [Naegleria fowleri]